MGTFMVSNPVGTTRIPAQTDWLAISKTVSIELAFVGSVVAILTGRSDPTIVNLAITTGATIGVLRLSDVAANLVNVRSFLNAPNAATTGVVPQAAGTPLVTTPVATSNGTAEKGS